MEIITNGTLNFITMSLVRLVSSLSFGFGNSCCNVRVGWNETRIKSSSHEIVNATRKSTVSPSYVVLPYIKGVTERITRTLQREKIRVSFQPTRTL